MRDGIRIRAMVAVLLLSACSLLPGPKIECHDTERPACEAMVAAATKVMREEGITSQVETAELVSQCPVGLACDKPAFEAIELVLEGGRRLSYVVFRNSPEDPWMAARRAPL